jgi:hypothetical protein
MTQSIAKRAVGTALLVAATFAFGARADAFSGNYKILARHSGKAVVVQGASTADGAALVQWTYGGSATNDEWQIVDIGSGFYKILNANSGKAMNVRGNSLDDGAVVQQWTYSANSTPNDEWSVTSVGSGYYKIIARSSGKALNVTGSSTADGAAIIQWTYDPSPNSEFQIVSVSGSTTPTPTQAPTTGATATHTATKTATPTTVAGAGNFPARFATPYVETWNNNNLVTLSNNSGHKFWTLAFVISNGGCTPTWNGDTSLTGNSYGTYITNLRSQLGGDVIVSFGGASGTELGQACTSVSSLQGAYQKVIDQFKLTWIDLDIESGAESDTASVDRRNKALKALEAANPSLRVSYTLAVDRSGLPSGPLNLLKNAKSNGTRVDVVNVMAMDYGPCYSDMGQAGVDAANATKNQLSSNGISAKVGITPMIGTNDVACEKFSTSDATVVANYAQANSYVRTLGFWAIGADGGYSYTHIFHPFH